MQILCQASYSEGIYSEMREASDCPVSQQDKDCPVSDQDKEILCFIKQIGLGNSSDQCI